MRGADIREGRTYVHASADEELVVTKLSRDPDTQKIVFCYLWVNRHPAEAEREVHTWDDENWSFTEKEFVISEEQDLSSLLTE